MYTRMGLVTNKMPLFAKNKNLIRDINFKLTFLLHKLVHHVEEALVHVMGTLSLY